MLVIADVIKDSKMLDELTGISWKNSEKNPVTGYSGKFTWFQDSTSRFDWRIDNFIKAWDKLPYSEFSRLNSNSITIPHFISITDSNTEPLPRGTKYGKPLIYLCYNKFNSTGECMFGKKDSHFSTDSSNLIPLTIINNGISLSSYSGIEVWRNNTKDYETGKISGTEEVKKWIPADINDNGYQGQNPKYGWWED